MENSYFNTLGKNFKIITELKKIEDGKHQFVLFGNELKVINLLEYSNQWKIDSFFDAKKQLMAYLATYHLIINKMNESMESEPNFGLVEKLTKTVTLILKSLYGITFNLTEHTLEHQEMLKHLNDMFTNVTYDEAFTIAIEMLGAFESAWLDNFDSYQKDYIAKYNNPGGNPNTSTYRETLFINHLVSLDNAFEDYSDSINKAKETNDISLISEAIDKHSSNKISKTDPVVEDPYNLRLCKTIGNC